MFECKWQPGCGRASQVSGESSPIRRQFQIVPPGGGEVQDSPRVGVRLWWQRLEYIATPPYHIALAPSLTRIQPKSKHESYIIYDIWWHDNRFEVNWPPEPTLVLRWISKFFLSGALPSDTLKIKHTKNLKEIPSTCSRKHSRKKQEFMPLYILNTLAIYRDSANI